ncbi:cob(I)yrinic acid a,c-diamide adenosyltransferase [Aminipila sp.]|uniref:cob(I)yrinic acid a,c-diamide adenosyltransferase n=1 Tax=Aminipila sp. TaxID=2060095 RepID=UPI00289BC80A|nr:cob(I)yrinic acid a,c-diamide adenosyltransferase [Aminipila sp.]
MVLCRQEEIIMEKGYIQLYTGNGKGKTTAAFGLALRAAMAGKRIYIGQFIKGIAYEETKCTKYISGIDIEQYGTGCLIDREPDKDDRKRAVAGLERCKEALTNGKYDVVIMDEITITIFFHLLSDEEVISAIQARKNEIEVILTGRYASDKLIAAADLVSEMREVKHYYSQGILSRKGIDC